MAEKIPIATAWLQSCSGCHMSLLDLDMELVDLLDIVEIKYSPIVDTKEIPNVKLALVEGAVSNVENEKILKELREKAEILVSLGTCACFGGLPGLRNLYDLKDLFNRAYIETESSTNNVIPSHKEIPELLKNVKTVPDVVKVDYIIPGCPPLPSVIKDALLCILTGKEYKLLDYSLCKECPLEHYDILVAQRQFLTFDVVGLCELDQIREGHCFLEQGVLCMGLVTRAGCHARCMKANNPCRGCMGPTSNILDQGAKLVDSLANILPTAQIVFREDIVGTGYRFSLADSIYPTKEDNRSE